MNWLIIGSVAAKHWFPDFRQPSDIDILTPVTITGGHSGVCIVETSWHEVAQELIDLSKDKTFLDADLLFTLKASHAEWNIKWEKTMADIAFFKRHECKLNYRMYHKLQGVWKQIHRPKRVNMARKMDEFFKDAVEREHDHERLHELVAFYDRPLHERLRTDHTTAWCSEELFLELSYDDQCKVALEEMLATAIERSGLKPGQKTSEYLIAVHRAHFQLVTSMTTGWFARFLILNRVELLIDRRTLWLPILKKALSSLQKPT